MKTRAKRILSAALAALFHILIDFIPKSLHVRGVQNFVNRHESNFVPEFTEVHSGTVRINVVVLLQIIKINAEGNQYFAGRNRLSVKGLGKGSGGYREKTLYIL